ncbi:copper homeostasis membrane protein CopD [Entomohabitans teleogrylli]|uniref:copper homeostasis membrane protein CopD n=1 Tax=Entomohabitans teleogrylli TaxID=1384589 RepID=UPI00073D4C7E|nr:copper homeostasis membrane protein CopD [Entomohabitans teleogrylli]
MATLLVLLRLIHFGALMLLAGSCTCSSLLASGDFQRLMIRRLARLWLPAAIAGLMSALLLFALQGGLMAGGWADTVKPQIWRALLNTRFGAVWLWQMVLALAGVMVVIMRPRRLSGLLLLLTCAQLILMAGVGHAAAGEGISGALQRINHGVHLLAASWWVGGLLPLLACMQMARKARWRKPAIQAMMRFSRYGHAAVVLVIVSGMVNSLMILGVSWPWHAGYVRLLVLKTALVAAMIFIAVWNRYILVPRFARSDEQAKRGFIRLTCVEVALSALVLALVSLFATWEPF